MHLVASPKEDTGPKHCLWRFHKAELEGQHPRAGMHPSPALVTLKTAIFEGQNKQTKLASSILDFFSVKVNVTSSDRLLGNPLARAKTALKSSLAQVCYRSVSYDD